MFSGPTIWIMVFIFLYFSGSTISLLDPGQHSQCYNCLYSLPLYSWYIHRNGLMKESSRDVLGWTSPPTLRFHSALEDFCGNRAVAQNHDRSYPCPRRSLLQVNISSNHSFIQFVDCFPGIHFRKIVQITEEWIELVDIDVLLLGGKYWLQT